MKHFLLGCAASGATFGLCAYTVLAHEIAVVRVDKMNVLYKGIDNTLHVAVSGTSPDDLEVSSPDPIRIAPLNGCYSIAASQIASPTLTINVRNKKTNKVHPFEFRVKNLPYPTVRLSSVRFGGGGDVLSSDFRKQVGFTIEMSLDIDAHCIVESYTMCYTAKGQALSLLKGSGARFTEQILEAVQKAQAGDRYQFVDIKVRCPGDATHSVHSLAFSIK